MTFSVLIAALVGFLAARLLWLALRSSWNVPALQRQNYRGVTVPTAAGIVLSFALLTVEGLRAIFGGIGLGEDGGLSPIRAAALIVVMGFTALGLIDDLIGTSSSKGLAGHLRALGRGTLTTGAVKLFGGVALALIASSIITTGGIVELVLDAAVIALAANLANQFDLRPGRVTKIGVLAFVLLAIFTGLSAELAPVAIVVGAAFALLLDDMHERLMLGDTGANALGAALGLGLAATVGTTGAIVAVVLLVGLTLLGDVISFSSLFEKVAPLRAFDRLGRKADGSETPRFENRPSAPSPDDGPSAPSERARINERPITMPADDESDAMATPSSIVDLRAEDELPEDEPDRMATDAPYRATVENAHAGATASPQPSSEPSPFSSWRSREQSSTANSSSASSAYDDDFDDVPDFFSPARPPAPPSSASRPEQRPLADRYHSPFDDDEDDR